MGKELLVFSIMAEKRTENLTIRMTPSEKEEWYEKAARSGLTVSQLLRLAIKRTNTWTVPDHASIKEQTRQIVRIGNNLNQIAKWANTYKSTAEAIEVIEALRLIEEALNQIATNSTSSSAEKESNNAT